MNMQQINQEYEKLCTKVGDASYKIKQYELLIKSLYKQIDKLNKLAAIIQQVENDPCAGLHGASYISPVGPGLGKF